MARASGASGDRGAEVCPRCGAPLRIGPARGSGAVVEGSAGPGTLSAELPPEDPETADAADGPGGAPTTALVVTRPSLPAVLWGRPAVRAAARAGAGALALTLGLRLARAWRARPRAPRSLATAALPTLTDLLIPLPGEHSRWRRRWQPRRGACGREVRRRGLPGIGINRGARPGAPGGGAGGRGVEVVETVVFMQRVVRRR